MRTILLLIFVCVCFHVSTFGQVAKVDYSNGEEQKRLNGDTILEENNMKYALYDKDWNPVILVAGSRTSLQNDTINYRHNTLKPDNPYYEIIPLNQQGPVEYVIMLADPFELPAKARPLELPTQQLIPLNGVDQGYVKIFDNIGWLVMEKTINTAAIDISELPKGVYWMSIHSDNQVLRERFIKE